MVLMMMVVTMMLKSRGVRRSRLLRQRLPRPANGVQSLRDHSVCAARVSSCRTRMNIRIDCHQHQQRATRFAPGLAKTPKKREKLLVEFCHEKLMGGGRQKKTTIGAIFSSIGAELDFCDQKITFH